MFDESTTDTVLYDSQSEDVNLTDNVQETGTVQDDSQPINESTTGTVQDDSQPKEGANYYSDEEFNELIRKGAVFMDSSRVSPEHKAYFEAILERERAIQADYTRKTQELAQIRRQLESQQLSPEQRFYREFFQNPAKIRTEVANVMTALEQQEVEALESMDYQKVKELRNQKAILQKTLAQAESMLESTRQSFDIASHIDMAFKTELLKEIPDFFTTKQYELSNYLAQEGVDPRVQSIVSNPIILDYLLKASGITEIDGITAAKQIVKLVNKVYEKANAANAAEKKVVKKPPITGKTSLSNVSADESIKSIKQKAMQSGDIGSWAEYLLAKSK